MDHQLPEGLNFVPRLVRTSSPPPSSSRSRTSLSPKLSENSLVFFNGNYEGDITMFREVNGRMRLGTFPILESDTDTEMNKDVELYKEQRQQEAPAENQLWIWIKQLMLHCLSPETAQKITQYTEKFLQCRFCAYMKICWKYISISLLLILKTSIVICAKLNFISRGLWRLRSLLRTITRRLLWWLTLAKCGDLSLFALALVCTPCIFLIAAVGLILSLYSTIRNVLHEAKIPMRIRKLFKF